MSNTEPWVQVAGEIINNEPDPKKRRQYIGAFLVLMACVLVGLPLIGILTTNRPPAATVPYPYPSPTLPAITPPPLPSLRDDQPALRILEEAQKGSDEHYRWAVDSIRKQNEDLRRLRQMVGH